MVRKDVLLRRANIKKNKIIIIDFNFFQLHTASYKSGVIHYSEGEWEESVEFFEKAIIEFIQAEDQCRLECEKPFDMGWFPDFVTAVASEL